MPRRDFLAEKERLQKERQDAFSEYIADVKEGRFPEKGNLIEMDDERLADIVSAIEE